MKKFEPQHQRDQKILILAPTGRDAALTARFLEGGGLPSDTCGSVEELCQKLQEGAGLVFLTGEALTREAMLCLAEALGRQPAWSDVPVVLLTSGGGDAPANAEAIAELSEAGNVTLIERPVRVATLMSAFKSALRARRRQYEVRDYLIKEEVSKEALRRSEEQLREALEGREQLLVRERAARAEAEESSRLKDEFLATVSHELRTPMTAVLGWTHLLRDGRLDAKGAAHALATVERNAHAQHRLIEDLLDVSRIITGKLGLDVRRVAPASFIEAAMEAVLPAAEAKGIVLEKSLPPDAAAIPGDPARLQQVIWNLLSNAIKFTPKGGSVRLGLENAGSHVEIFVSDTGDGIKREFLPYVFDRFRQEDGTTARRYGGLGLGLAIVRHLVELHGGTVRAESPGEGQGATFTVRLPLVVAQKSDDGNAAAPHTPAVSARRAVECPDKLDGLRVLVVDDEADTLDLIKVLLAQCGAEVATAKSSAEALGLFAEATPDVIISDIGMPGEDGFELIRKVRELPPERGGRTPAVALTAYARAADRLRVLRSGYQMHVAKPVELAELVAVVANVAGRV
ncbi:MAG TPA: ATP-binding protein [Pyrinomonadaceae bacterium]|nr:ATP-binding protein [Pyrinomonadaceae bacterium]